MADNLRQRNQMEAEKLTPPYVGYGTFKNFVSGLVETTVPTHIDRGVLNKMSGSSRTALLSALRYLGLTAGDDETTETLHALVTASNDEDAWKRELRVLFDARFKTVTSVVNLERGTMSQLEKAFQGAGVRAGQMCAKSVRFFVSAAQDAGVDIGDHILKGTPSKGSIPRRKTKAPRRDPPADEGNGGGEVPPPPGLDDYVVPLPTRVAGALIRFPKDIKPHEVMFFEHAVAYLKLYAQQREKGGDEE